MQSNQWRASGFMDLFFTTLIIFFSFLFFRFDTHMVDTITQALARVLHLDPRLLFWPAFLGVSADAQVARHYGPFLQFYWPNQLTMPALSLVFFITTISFFLAFFSLLF